jgi:class 3 adenylate cyclase
VGITDYVLSVSRDAEATLLFADIAGFTALTEAHSDEGRAVRVRTLRSRVKSLRSHSGHGWTPGYVI